MNHKSSGSPKVCLVVSHFNAWPIDKLIALLDQTMKIPSGVPFHTRVVVNQAVDKRLKLPKKYAHVEVLHRENVGYNIGAWEHGWRAGTPFPTYLFLQEECRILRQGWVGAFDRETSKPEVGLVGESLVCESSWETLKSNPPDIIEGVCAANPELFVQWYDLLKKLDVPPGLDGRHLQSLIFAARREVLERIGGFPQGAGWIECIAAEIAVSKKVLAAGLEIKQVDPRRFAYILHPQWKNPLWKSVAKKGLAWAPEPSRRWAFSVWRTLQTR